MNKMGKIAVVLLLAFVMVLATLGAAAAAYDRSFTKLFLKSHEPIFIDGNHDFLKTNGVTGGSGNESDPYVIEGWTIQTSADCGISINDTDANVVIRNVSIESDSYSYDREVGAGLILSNSSNVRIESIEVFGFRIGALFNGSTDAMCNNLAISQSRFSSNLYQIVVRNTTSLEITRIVMQPYYYDSGILLDNCTDFDVRSCIIQIFGIDYISTAASGICARNSSGGTLEDNLIRWPDTYSAKGIWIRNSTALLVTNNSLEDIREMSIWVETSSNVSIVDNNIEGWDNEGIFITHSSRFVVANNIFSREWSQSGASLSAYDSENAIICNNSLIECGGLSVFEGRNILVSDNLVDGAGYGESGYRITGLYVKGTNITATRNFVTEGLSTGVSILGDHITFLDNEISDNCGRNDMYDKAGILASGTNLTIAGNKIQNNTHEQGSLGQAGVWLERFENSTFRENRVSDAMNVFYCEYAEVSANHFCGNWTFTFFASESSANVSFFGNSFFGDISVSNHMASGVLQWNAGYPTGGNYWEQYTGEDLKSGSNQNQPGSDGIGDVAYELSPGEWDSYPLIAPLAIFDHSAPLTYAYLSGDLGTLGWYKSSVNVSFRAADTLGEVNSTYFSLDGKTSDSYSSTFSIVGDGRHLLEFFSVDMQGNIEQNKTIELWVDTTPPFALGTIETEYRFKGVGRGYIYPSYQDNTSALGYFVGAYEMGPLGYYTTCSFMSVGLYDGTNTYAVTAFDSAGNSCQQNITIQSTLRPNTDLLSLDGPYGPLYAAGVAIDLGLLMAAMVALSMSHDWPPRRLERRDEGERHYDEDVVDGYPKYKRRI